jgi:hypothetical protein
MRPGFNVYKELEEVLSTALIAPGCTLVLIHYVGHSD